MAKNFLLYKIAVVAVASVLFTGTIAPAGARAAEGTVVEKLVDYSISKNVTATKTVTADGTDTVVNIKSVYPYIKIPGNADLAKTVRKTVKRVAFTNIASKYAKNLAAGDVLPENAVVNVEITFDPDASSRCGNIASFVFNKSAYVEGGAFPANETLVVNVNLSTGKSLILTSLFKSKTKVKDFLAGVSKDYADAMYASAAPMFEFSPETAAEYAFFEDLQLEDVRNAIDIYGLKFNWDGVTVYFDETDGLWPHAFGTQTVFIPYGDFSSYIKASAVQLFRPYSVEVINLEYNAGTGYGWTGEVNGDGCLELVYEGSYAKNPSPMLMGGRMCEVLVFKAVKEGRADIDYKLARPWETNGTPADTYSRKLIVTSDMFITDDNGEN